MNESAISEAVDRLQILDVFARYALGMDRGERELFFSVWTEDAVFTAEAIQLDLHGREAIMDYYDHGPGIAPRSPDAGSAIRLASNHHIDVRGDRATSLAEMTAFRITGDSVHTYSVGVYEDKFVRTREGWRMSRRNMVVSVVLPRAQDAQ